MKEKDEIADLFHSKLSHHAEQVDPALWSKVQAGLKVSSITTAGSVAGKSIGVVKTLIIASGLVVVTGTVAVLVLNKDSQNTQDALIPTSQNNDAINSQEPPSLSSPSQITIEDPKSDRLTEKPVGKELAQQTESVDYQSKDNELGLVSAPHSTFKNLPENHEIDLPETKARQPRMDAIPSTGNQSEYSAASPNPKNEPSYLLTNNIPNIFTPNSDGKNDVFSIPVTEGVTHTTKIFSAKGELVASFDEKTNGWDGTILGGNEAANGTYFYVTFVSDSQGHEQQYKGSIYLKR